MGHAGRHYPNSLRKYRKRLGYSQKKAARIIGVTVSQISRWEHGERSPDLIRLIQLSVLYRTSLGELYEELFQVHKGEMEQHFLIADKQDSENLSND